MTTQLIITAIMTGDWIAIIGLSIGLLGTIIVFSAKAGRLTKTVEVVETDVSIIKSDLKDLLKEFPVISSRVNDLWSDRVSRQRSPKVLNAYGKKILKESKIDVLVEEHYDEILKKVRELEPQNAYRAEENVISVVADLELIEKSTNQLEKAAYATGENVATILYVGAINIRDDILNELGLNIDDIDKYDPSLKDEN